MVTNDDRFEYFKRSYRCFCEQTYPNRELLIVTDGSEAYQKQIREHVWGDSLLGFSGVRLLFLKGKYTLGALRNISILLCNGPLWVQWDDDDFNIPERLAVQYSFFEQHPEAKICYLSDQLHYYFNTKELYWENWRAFHSGDSKKWALIPGTGMARKKEVCCRYPSAGDHCSAGEDSVFACDLLEKDERSVVLLGMRGYMQVYTYHGANVWNLEHHKKISNLRSMSVRHMLDNDERICESIRSFELEGPIKVMGREGLAFTYDH
jgi:glycosyltransferase involved in cell wall biosynthesis